MTIIFYDILKKSSTKRVLIFYKIVRLFLIVYSFRISKGDQYEVIMIVKKRGID